MLHGVSVFTVAAVLLLILLSATGLLGVWVALGRGHWFVRMLGLAAWLGMWLLVPAYEITAILFFESLVVVPPLLLARHLRARVPGGPLVQFGLRDLLLLVVVVAAVSAAGTAAPRSVWTSWEVLAPPWDMPPWLCFAILGTAQGGFILLAKWIAMGRSRVANRLCGFCAAALLLMVLTGDSLSWTQTLLTILMGLAVPVAVLSTVSIVSRPNKNQSNDGFGVRRPTARRMSGLLAGLLVAGLVVPSLGLFYVLMTPPPIVTEPLPVPNGYDTLLRIGRLLEAVTVPQDRPSRRSTQRLSPDAFRAFRMQHSTVVSEARAALDMPCRVPIAFDLDHYYYEGSAEDANALRQLARALVANGRAASNDGDNAVAASCYLDTVRLGRQIGRGAIFVPWCVAVDVEIMGLDEFHRSHTLLPNAVRRETRCRLRELREQRELLETCWRRTEIIEANIFGWQGRLLGAIEGFTGKSADRKQWWERRRVRHADALQQILLAELALADYRDEHGAYPKTLDALVPAYLDETPKDPYGTGLLVYRTTDKGYELYSVGDNGLDDGGKSALEADFLTGDDVWFWK